MQGYLVIPNRNGKCLFVMSYAKDSGKTSFGEFIENYFPVHMVQRADMDYLGDKFSYAGMEQAVLLSCLEMSVSRLNKKTTKALKSFTGERKMAIEAKYQNRKTANIKFKTLLASNGGLYLPAGEMDNAFYRRVIVIPFVQSKPLDQLDADLKQKLEQERSAIISKSLRKLDKYIKKDGSFVFPESSLSMEIKAGWMGLCHINTEFIEQAVVFTADAEDAIPKADLKAAYDKYYFIHAPKNGNNKPLKCSKDDLVRLIRNQYPNVQEKQLRRPTMEDPENISRQHCIVGIRWAKKFLDDINESMIVTVVKK